MIIGRFAQNPASGVFIGHIRTLFFKSDKVVFEPIAAATERAPSHRVFTADEVELGAAWTKQSKAGGAIHYEVTLDDPTFAQPIYARLEKAKGKGKAGFILFWNRAPKKKSAA